MMAQRSLLGGDSRVDEKTASEGNEELDRMEIRMRMRYGENRRRDKGVPIACDCSAAVLVATSRDPNTRGKLYFSCPYEISDGPGRGCGFMRWWTVALCDEFEKIKEESNEMKQDLDAAKKRIEARGRKDLSYGREI
ncbi:unnamed protein product [Arabidopsis halleri]